MCSLNGTVNSNITIPSWFLRTKELEIKFLYRGT